MPGTAPGAEKMLSKGAKSQFAHDPNQAVGDLFFGGGGTPTAYGDSQAKG